MSKKHPECPLFKHGNCKELYNQQLCAIVREDKICLKKQRRKVHAEFIETVKRIKDNEPDAIVDKDHKVSF